MDNELEILAQRHNTDKQMKDHGYTETYYDLFSPLKNEIKHFLEIGVWFGGSHRMWNDFFPMATIYGVDTFQGVFHKYKTENPSFEDIQIVNIINMQIQELADEGMKIVVADQMNRDVLLEQFKNVVFDVIIDDGGHGAWQQQKSFRFLWDKVISDGYYIIEDLGIGYDREFREFDDISSSTPEWLKSIFTDDPYSHYIPEEELLRIKNEIEYIHFVGELAIIKKKCDKAFVRDLIGEEDPIIFEIGCADGKDTLEFIKAFKDTNFRMYCFEPDPRNVKTFAENVHDERVSFLDWAIGNRNGQVEFNQSTCNRDTGQQFIYSSSLREPGDKLFETWPEFQDRNNFRKIKVNSIRLDAFVTNLRIKNIDFVWMDVQGAEDLVIEGGQWALNNITRYIYTECNNEDIYEGAPSLTKILAMLPDFDVVQNFGADVLLKNRRFE